MYDERKIFSDTYTILGKLGSGSGGTVYKAYHKRLQTEVVIKKLHSRSEDVEHNRKEVDILKRLNHSYLPQVLDFLTTEDGVYTVMSFIPGKSFKQLLQEGHRFSRNQLMRWGMQLCSALYYLHSQVPPIIHGDIKPANIMLTPEGNICLIDFNVSFFLDGNTVLGYTNGYTSPEQYIIALDKKTEKSIPKSTLKYSKVDEKSDIYSVGATFYHLVTGKKVDNYNSLLDMEMLREYVGEAFAEIIYKSMQINPKKRYQNALEMFYAFQNVNKKDNRYRKLLIKQRVLWGVQVLLISCFIVIGGYGVYNIKAEKVKKYNNLVEKQIAYRKQRDYENAERIHEKAVAIYPKGVESFYQNALSLYESQNYETCLEFIDYNILGNEKLNLLSERAVDIYYLKAESYFELKDYQKSADAFERVVQYGNCKSEYYRDYAVVLAYNGQLLRAEEILEDAIEKGLTEDMIYYVKGEIEKASKKYIDAEREFLYCIECTQNDDLEMRAYVMLSEIYKEENDAEKELEILEQARLSLPMFKQMLILERMVQININLADISGKDSYRNNAIELLEEIIYQEWDTWKTYDNLVVLNQKLGRLDVVQKQLEIMRKKYGETYNLYKRYAFLEISLQEKKRNEERNYASFNEYYKKAVQMYDGKLKDNVTDPEMQLLDNIYQQVLEGGWLQ